MRNLEIRQREREQLNAMDGTMKIYEKNQKSETTRILKKTFSYLQPITQKIRNADKAIDLGPLLPKRYLRMSLDQANRYKAGGDSPDRRIRELKKIADSV